VSHILPLSVAPVGYFSTISESTGSDDLLYNRKHNSVYTSLFSFFLYFLFFIFYFFLKGGNSGSDGREIPLSAFCGTQGSLQYSQMPVLDPLLSHINPLGVILSFILSNVKFLKLKLETAFPE